jgi:cytochrome o ubiquinol oxidase subunit 2
VIWSAPLLIIICLGALTWWSTHLLDPYRPLDRIAAGKAIDPKAKPLVVQVVSLDWKWLFIYPEQGIATVNELVLPVDRRVRFELTSTNMMNTFYAPTLAGMIYTMPGMRSTLHAVLNRPASMTACPPITAAPASPTCASSSTASTSRLRRLGRAREGERPARSTPPASSSSKSPSEKVPACISRASRPDLFDRISIAASSRARRA